MRYWRIGAFVGMLAIAAPSLAQQIGPPIRVGPGEVSVGGLGVKKGKPSLPSADDVINTVVDSHPATMFLSGADKQNVKKAIITTGFVAAVTSDPTLALIILTVILPSGEKRDIPVPNNPGVQATGKIWKFSASCIVQQPGNLIAAFFSEDPEHIKDANYGDTLELTAPLCAEQYPKTSVTAVKIKLTGKTHVDDAKPPIYRHYFTGTPT